MEKKTKQLIRNLTIFFRTALFLSVLAGGIQFIIPQPMIEDPMLKINLQSASILILLACIPLGLKLYHKKITRETLPKNDDEKIPFIQKWFIIRLLLIEITLLSNVAVYIITQNTSSLFGFGISFIVLLFFCKPNKSEITNILATN